MLPTELSFGPLLLFLVISTSGWALGNELDDNEVSEEMPSRVAPSVAALGWHKAVWNMTTMTEMLSEEPESLAALTSPTATLSRLVRECL